MRILDQADRGIEQLVVLAPDQETRLPGDRRCAHRPEQMADDAIAHARIEHHRHAARRHRVRGELAHRALARLASDRRRIGQVGAVAARAIGIVGLLVAALARHHAGRQRMRTTRMRTGEAGAGGKRKGRARQRGGAAVGIGHPGDGARRLFRRQRGFAQILRARLCLIGQIEIAGLLREQRIGAGEARIGILGRQPRHFHRARCQHAQTLGREIAGADRGVAAADEDAQADFLAFGAFDVLQCAQPHGDALGGRGAGHRIGGVGAHGLREVDEFTAAVERRLRADHGRVR